MVTRIVKNRAQAKKRASRKNALNRSKRPILHKQARQANKRHLSVIIPVQNEEKTIEKVLQQAERLHPKEILVIANGCQDQTPQLVARHRVIRYSYPFRLGHDVGRAIGAREATGDVLLFIDGDMVIPAEYLQLFVSACYRGTDISLNNVNPFLNQTAKIDAISMAKSYLNRMLLRPDLGFSSLTAVPHAMKRSAVSLLGYDSLMVPPLAQTIAILQGLRVEHPASVNVIRLNRKRSNNRLANNQVRDMILGDHLEAFQYLQEMKSERAFFPDQLRRRHLFQQMERTEELTPQHLLLPADI
ncbi:glycosyltransferase family 2 protein [Brevibacillus composti]|uniref:4,4'-diaponeurosporenoate glycosyltransferase n=1 Tax=Brevibacillus composti TaxID=2796470 RepID=A0A7T5EHF3_9BACL|nr:glycosyltransferase family A protein [Brevibacillus composti]QQE72669.1 glycosyltransferase family 2 protein [Brevibacillus composti]QUO39747.1 glycosyltransferase family 2 protein [Brevibacillus composti]